MATLSDWLGMAGALVIVVTYLLLQTDRLDARDLSFSVANSLGAVGIIISLLDTFNLSAFVIELFWLAISLYGVFRALKYRRVG